MQQTNTVQAGARTHTPGPWTLEEALTVSGPPNRHYLKACGNKAVAIINGSSEANARLIAAAPELLEAVKFFLTSETVRRATYATD